MERKNLQKVGDYSERQRERVSKHKPTQPPVVLATPAAAPVMLKKLP